MACGDFIQSPYGAALVVSSTTRPTGADLYFGRLIAEADTGRLLFYDGTGWIILYEPWQAFTPTTANLTVGNGTFNCSYQRSAGNCKIEFQFTLGSTSAIGTNPNFTVPFAPLALTRDVNQKTAELYDASASIITGVLTSATTFVFFGALNAAATYAGLTLVTATIPFTWAISDYIAASFEYRMLSPYS